jgi:F420-non-reducing hydrogenase iron-sulfur subunit
MASDYEPRIISFLCTWCTYTAADTAGISRMRYPPNVDIIRVMCSGSVDPTYVLRPLLDGVDGVLIGGCHPGDCHYQSGNYKARRRIVALKMILDSIGLDDERVWLRWISGSEAGRFAETVGEMTETLREKGASPMRERWAV